MRHTIELQLDVAHVFSIGDEDGEKPLVYVTPMQHKVIVFGSLKAHLLSGECWVYIGIANLTIPEIGMDVVRSFDDLHTFCSETNSYL